MKSIKFIVIVQAPNMALRSSHQLSSMNGKRVGLNFLMLRCAQALHKISHVMHASWGRRDSAIIEWYQMAILDNINA